MCNFASFILTKTGEFWCSTDKHEDIIAEQKLNDKKQPPDFVRVEILPNEQTRRDLSTWTFCVDQDIMPEWTFSGDPELERRARAALTRRSEAEHWFEDVIAHQAVSGYAGTATAGDDGTATAGYAGTATAGDDGTATAGARGTATAGARGTATAGDDGTATAGDDGTATAGDDGILNIRWWDGKRYRIATFYVGENGIEPNVPYGVNDKGQPVKRDRKP
jgi:hypothetical protein